MRVPGLLLLTILLMAPGAALAGEFTSGEFGFSADYPGTPAPGAAEDSEKGPDGAVISRSTAFDDVAKGVYFATVTADRYIVPAGVDAGSSLKAEHDQLIKAINGTSTVGSMTAFQGHPAMQFAFDTPDHAIRGQGMIVVVESAYPTIYLVVACRFAGATADTEVALDRFFTSFHLN